MGKNNNEWRIGLPCGYGHLVGG
jgi:hypothetical protein